MTCINCGAEISPQRLAALPHTLVCLTCRASDDEKLQPLSDDVLVIPGDISLAEFRESY